MKTISRREFIRVCTLVVAGAAVASCARPEATPTVKPAEVKPTETKVAEAPKPTEVKATEVPEATAKPAAPVSKYQEAPMLAELVKAGELPPVDERLPINPMVVEPWESMGDYGGTWNMGLRGSADNALLIRTIGYEYFFRWDIGFTMALPNIIESYQVSDDASEWTFFMRKGMKWSDGEDFTAEDIMFWYYDFQMNEELSPGGPPVWLKVDGEPAEVTKVDDYTIKMSFVGANGLLHAMMAHPNAAGMTQAPKHWLTQYHKDYNDEVDAIAEDEGYEDWVELFLYYAGAIWTENERPTLHAWMMSSAYGEETSIVRAVRNPYYWKTDPNGRQLPYIDNVVYDVVEDAEVLLLKAMNGEIDHQARHIATEANKAVLAENREKGDYHFAVVKATAANRIGINLNLTHQDPVKREIFSNKDFRAGLSHAINRQEIIDVVWLGRGEPHQVAPMADSKYYNEQLATQFLEYNVDKANEYLDKAGLTEKDGDGFRLMPNGERLTIIMELITAHSTDIMELIKNYWAEVGVDMQIRQEERSIFYDRHAANLHDASQWSGDSGGRGFAVVMVSKLFLPYHTGGSRYGLPWAYWYNNPDAEIAEEPPPEVLRQQELYKKALTVASDEKRDELMTEILQIAADQFYTIGLCTSVDGYAIVSNKMHNVPECMGSWAYPNPGPSNTEQFWLEEEA